jgi:hypothetical protein
MRIMLALLVAAVAAPASAQTVASLAGTYDGHQMEMGAMLRLTPDGRFDYGLAYGALDETGKGSWALKDGKVLLTSDPVTPPRFVFAGQKTGAAGVLDVALKVPKGMSPRYFDVAVTLTKGEPTGGQFSEAGGLSIPVDPVDPPRSVRVFLPMFELASDPVPVDPSKGYALSFRFEPNDIGKADFRGTALKIDKGDLVFDRFDRTIRFRRIDPR